MDLGLAGKVALVCGASTGIGFAAAEELAANGVTLVICARDRQRLEAARALLAPTAKSVLAVPGDVSTAEGVHAVTSQALATYGRVDVLVTNTGGPKPGPADSHDWPAWEAAVALLLKSVVELTRAVLPGMRERRWGRVIAITSMAVKQPVDNLVLSNSVRAAVTGYCRTLANEVASHGVTVNTVLPGYTNTDRLADLARATSARSGKSTSEVEAQWTREVPAGRIGEPHEIAAVVAFLASVRASYVTGQSIAADGGWIKSLL
jgi:3-oxoacyl-[acyl-carrier protein] reductase